MLKVDSEVNQLIGNREKVVQEARVKLTNLNKFSFHYQESYQWLAQLISSDLTVQLGNGLYTLHLRTNGLNQVCYETVKH